MKVTDATDPKAVNVKRCTACSKDHQGLQLQPLKRAWKGAKHFTTCPATGAKLMVRKAEEGKP